MTRESCRVTTIDSTVPSSERMGVALSRTETLRPRRPRRLPLHLVVGVVGVRSASVLETAATPPDRQSAGHPAQVGRCPVPPPSRRGR